MNPDANPLFESVLDSLTDRQREQVEAAYALLEHGREPVHRQDLPALGDPTGRERLEELLRRTGRVLVPVDGVRFTSGYDDAVAARLTGDGWQPLSAIERAVLVLVLVYSVAIPRSEERLAADAWASPYPTGEADVLRASKLPAVAAKAALSRLVGAGLLGRVRDRAGAEGGYVPGPQLLRLTPAARERLQDQLILAAAPSHPLAAVIRERRRRAAGGSERHDRADPGSEPGDRTTSRENHR